MYKLIADVRIRKHDVNGNTYHDVTLIDATDGRVIDSRTHEYGYGSAFMQTITFMINMAVTYGIYTDETMKQNTIIIQHNHTGKVEAIW